MPRTTSARTFLESVPRSFVAATAIVAAGALLEFALPERPEVFPSRQQFTDFPLRLGEWVGQKSALEPTILDLLRLDDYLLADYQSPDGIPINLYVAFYLSQRNGMSIHSPARCLPAGGWQIRSFERYMLRANPAAWPVNRVLIEQGDQRALVYYWFQERGRRLTSEYEARWYLFWDSLTVHHTDGALVRLVIPVPKGADVAAFDARLKRFASTAETQLTHFVPD